MTGDVIASTFEFLLWDSDARFAEKRYNPCVVTLGQVWESFMRLFAASTYAYHPFTSDPKFSSADDLNGLLLQLHEAMTKPKKFAFDMLRNLIAHTTIARLEPRTVADAKRDIARITADHFYDRPSDQKIGGISDPIRREMVERLYRLTVGDLRNKCVHQAYVPTRAQAERCREEEIVFLFSLKHEFHVGDFDEVQCGAA